MLQPESAGERHYKINNDSLIPTAENPGARVQYSTVIQCKSGCRRLRAFLVSVQHCIFSQMADDQQERTRKRGRHQGLLRG
jgi:hypothetical protein